MSKIKIKRSTSANAPTGLEFGELAYSTAETAGGGTQANNGDRLFFKYNAAGAAAIIGGKYFTDMLDHVHGTLTADSAIITDDQNKIDVINVGNITITGSTNTISSTDAGGDIKLDTDTTGVVWVNDYYLPNNRGTGTTNNGFVLTMEDASIGKTSWKAPSTTLKVKADAVDGGDSDANWVKIDLLTEVLNIAGDSTQGIDTKVNITTTDNAVTITAKDATSSQKGVAKFDTTGFVVNTTTDKGNVTLKGDVAQSFAGDTGTGVPSSNSFSIIGDSSSSGIVTTGSSSQIKISANYASASQYGVAKFTAAYWSLSSPTADGVIGIKSATNTDLGLAYFPTAQFQVASGSVSVKNATLDNDASPTRGVSLYSNANFKITSDVVGTKAIKLGTTDLDLGSTVTSVVGMTEIKVGDFKLTDNKLEIVSTAASPDLILLPYIPGSGTVGQVKIANSWVLPNNAGSTAGYVLTSNGSNASTWQPVASTLHYKVDGDTSANDFDILNGELSILGSGAINTSTSGSTNKTISISVDTASDTVLGVATFSTDSFTVSGSGDVTIKAAGVTNTQLVNSKVTVGSTDISLGSSSTVLAGLTDVTIGKIQIKDVSNVGRITTSAGNLELNAFASVKIQGYYTLPNSAGSGTTAQTLAFSPITGGQALVTDGSGGSSWSDIPYVLEISDDTNDYVVDLLNTKLSITGDSGQGVSVVGSGAYGSDVLFEVSVANATDTTVGVARFKSGDFTVGDGTGGTNAGEVQLADTVVQSVVSDSGSVTPSSNSIDVKGYTGANANSNAVTTSASGSILTITARLASETVTGVASFNATNFTVDANGAVTSDKFTIGSTDFNLGQAATTTIAGLTDVTIGDLQIHDDNKITFVHTGITNGDIVLEPKGDGVVDVSSSRIAGVADPVDDYDAANKKYVDYVAQGLHTHTSADTATTDTLTVLSGGAVAYDNGVDGVGATITLTNALTTLDTHALTNGDRILVKNEGAAGGIGSYANGIYVRTSSTVLTRANDFDVIADISGGDFVFVVMGYVNGDTGWVQTEKVTGIGSGHPVLWNQFAGAGTFLAGHGLRLTGNEFSVKLSTVAGVDEEKSGLEFSGDVLHVAGTIAGDGLAYADGILTIGGTSNRITVNADTVDIASTYEGQDSIITLSNTTGVTTGTWKADTIAAIYGGTGHNVYGKGDILYADTTSGNTLAKLSGVAATSYQFLMMGADGLPAWADIDGGTY